jgi:hypothetical protein
MFDEPRLAPLHAATAAEIQLSKNEMEINPLGCEEFCQ